MTTWQWIAGWAVAAACFAACPVLADEGDEPAGLNEPAGLDESVVLTAAASPNDAEAPSDTALSAALPLKTSTAVAIRRQPSLAQEFETLESSVPPHSPSAAPPDAMVGTAGTSPAAHEVWDESWTDTTFDDCFTPVWSHWTVNFDALFWRRSTPNGLVLGMRPDGLRPNANQLTFDHESGPRLAIIRRGISGWDVELNYFGIEGWHATLDMPIDVDPRVPGDDPDGLFASDLNFLLPGAFIEYRSSVHSEELNLRHAIDETWTALIGFRAVQVHERFDAYFTDTRLPFYTITTDNRLYGFQVGGEGRLVGSERVGLLALAKAGLYENNSEQTTTDFSGLLAGVGSTTLNASTNQASFVGELGVTGIIRVTETIFIRVGYNIMWIDDVALAPKQFIVNEFATNLPGTPLEGIATDGHLILHGATVGVELSW
jgi:hypothetical protein